MWSKHYSILLAALLAVISASGCLQLLPALAPAVDDAESGLSPEFPFESNYVEVLGSRMHYVEVGAGKPILLVHGNPTSSYLWRNVIPQLSRSGRVIAVDLIGMGRSDKPALEYTFADHARYLQAFIERMRLRGVVLVLHDWGGALGFDYAANHLPNVEGIAFMEAVVRPMSWDRASLPMRYLFKRFRDPEDGHQIIAVDNYFVEKLLPMMAGRPLTEMEMDAYRNPYPTIESRKPVAMWPRELPFLDEEATNVERIRQNYAKVQASDIPLLLLFATPGAIFQPQTVDEIKAEIPRLKTVNVGAGFHYIQETQPTKIGDAIAAWIDEL